MEYDSNIPPSDLGNGFYQNPIIASGYADPSVIRVDSDYYMTHARAGFRSLLIWHSRDLVNWEPGTFALTNNKLEVWAPELVFCRETFYIYFYGNGKNFVITAKNIDGPWSQPIDLNVPGIIDPGHAVDDKGRRYLFVANGKIIPLTDDGLATDGEMQTVYDGWPVPEEWDIEGFCLESPKIINKDKYYYMLVAEGGTIGPPTSHLIAAARAEDLTGPWENSPHNPISHTFSKNEKWWSKGHGTLIDTPDGNWYIIYHGILKDYRPLGRMTLMEPIEWMDDHWFRIPHGCNAADPIKKPEGSQLIHGYPLGDDFSAKTIGKQWYITQAFDMERLKLENNTLELCGQGTSLLDTIPLVIRPSHISYEITVEMMIEKNGGGGLTIFYSQDASCGIALYDGKIRLYNGTRKWDRRPVPFSGNRIFLRLKNNQNIVSPWYSQDGETWQKINYCLDISGYHHNNFRGFGFLGPGLFALGQGRAIFKNFQYKGLERI